MPEVLIFSTSASTFLMVGMLSPPRRINTMPFDDIVVVVVAGYAQSRQVADADRGDIPSSTGVP